MLDTFALPSLVKETAAPALSFRLIDDFAALQALAPAWQALLEQSAQPQPMLAPDWLLTWWQIYGQGSGRRLCVGVLYEGDRLVALAPLCRRRYWHRPGIPFRRLEFLGCDVDEHDGVCSIYLDTLARKGCEHRATSAFVRKIADGAFGSWDEIVLSALNGADGTPERWLEAFQQCGYQGSLQTLTDAPYRTLPGSWDAFLAELNKKHRKYIKAALRDFETWAGADWKLEFAQSAHELARGFAILAELHNHRWNEGDGIAGAFAKPRFDAFHKDYVPRLFQAGKLQLFWLTVRGEPIAVNYQIVANNKVYYYQCGRSLNVPERIRPGIVMVALAIQHAILQGMSEYDFLGGAAQYKSAFTDTARPIVGIRVARNGPVEWLRRGARRVVDFARKFSSRKTQ